MTVVSPGRYPRTRLRRSRRTAALRSLVAETGLGPADLVWPVFVLEGEKRSEPVSAGARTR